jgi:hypothetical protein
MKPGIHHGIPEADYHADPCEAPSLSSGTIRALRRSPAHAYHQHPRLGGGESTSSQAQEDGTVLHGLILGTPLAVQALDFPDWRTKDAKAAREAAREAGAVPMLAHHFAELRETAAGIEHGMPRLPQGSPEATLIWQEGETWCRARVDWLPDDPTAPLYDLKTTGLSADPAQWQRNLVANYCIQAAWYLRGARALGLRPRDFLFIVAETTPPYGVSLMACAPSLMVYAEREIDRAMALWRRCLAAGEWPGYPTQPAYVDAPAWLLEQQEMQAMNDEALEQA